MVRVSTNLSTSSGTGGIEVPSIWRGGRFSAAFRRYPQFRCDKWEVGEGASSFRTEIWPMWQARDSVCCWCILMPTDGWDVVVFGGLCLISDFEKSPGHTSYCFMARTSRLTLSLECETMRGISKRKQIDILAGLLTDHSPWYTAFATQRSFGGCARGVSSGVRRHERPRWCHVQRHVRAPTRCVDA